MLQKQGFFSTLFLYRTQVNLPKHLPEGEGIDWNVVIVDATEIPIQRPKKTEEKL